MKINSLRLQAKGWSEEEIQHAQGVLLEAEAKKHPRLIFLEKAMYWILLLVVLIGSIIGMWMLLPFLAILNTWGAVLLIFIIGVVFGSISSILIKDVENLEIHHHLWISLIIPISAIITSIIITRQAQHISEAINISTQHNPLILGIVYSIGSLIPFSILLWYQRSEEYGSR
jgi:hypothetical protein